MQLNTKHISLLLIILFGFSGCTAQPRDPGVVGFDFEAMLKTKASIAKGDADAKAAYGKLLQEADECLALPLEKVTDGDVPPSGNKQDFFTIGKYSWPNPDTPDGMPWIRRDCDINPESFGPHYDLGRYNNTVDRVKLLSLAWFYSGEERYAAKAAQLLRVWFIDKDTRMNPHFQYASAQPGVVDGMPIGIIFGVTLIEMVDNVKLLTLSKSWTGQDDNALKAWFAGYVNWLRTSEYGIKESKGANNHGTWYAAQVAAYSLYTGNMEPVKEMAELGKKQIAQQVSADGSLPGELRRDWAFSYSVYGLRAFTTLALCADKAGEDLWNYKTPEGTSLRRAYDFLVPFLTEQKKWEWGVVRENEQTARISAPMMRWAARKYNSAEIGKAVEHLDSIYKKSLKTDWI